jgi:hypothetical protein
MAGNRSMAFKKGQAPIDNRPLRKHRFTMRQAIDLNCKDCIYDDQDVGNWRQQVTACTITDCPFHDHRPISRGERKL